MSRIKNFFILCCAAAALLTNPQGGGAAETLIIKGSTTVLPVAQAAAESFMKNNPDLNVSISGGGSGDGIKALIDKTTHIADSSREIKPEEIKLAESRGVKPQAHTVAIDAIVPIVHPANPIDHISIEQLSLIYQGKIVNWKELGWVDKKISVISRDTSSGTYESWEEKVLHKARVTPRAQLQISNGMIVQIVSRNKYALGYLGIGYLNKKVRPLKVNGMEATLGSVQSGRYPIARPLYMYTDGDPKGPAARFIKFLLGPEGQEIVKREGFVPVKK